MNPVILSEAKDLNAPSDLPSDEILRRFAPQNDSIEARPLSSDQGGLIIQWASNRAQRQAPDTLTKLHRLDPSGEIYRRAR